MTFHPAYVHIISSSVSLLSGHLMGNSCSVVHMFSLYFVILVISRFGFEGWIWVLIASVPDLCRYSSGRKSLSILVHGALLIELC